jgi:ABC-2 type transport system permease protein
VSDKSPASAQKRRGFDVWAVLGTALVTVIIVLVNFISARRYERFDLTRDSLFTLSGRTEEVLKKLGRPVDVYLFMSAGEPNFQEMRELLSRYQAKSQNLHAHFIDPDREPTRFRTIAEKYGVRVGLQENGQTEAELAALVTSGDKRWSITRDDLVDFDYDSLGEGSSGPKVNVKTEQALTGALVQVTSGRPTKVCVTEGHGEWPIEGQERSLVAAQLELKRENIVVETLSTRGKVELPATCDALFIVGPAKAFAPEESAALEKYVKAGGNVLVTLDPVLSGEQLLDTGLESFATSLGVRIDRNVVVELDAEHLLSPSPIEQFAVTGFSDHPVMRPLVGLGAPVVMLLARSFTVSEGSEAEPLMKSSDKAYGESQLGQLTAGDDLKAGDGDVKGPVTLAVAVDTRPEKEGEGGAPRTGGRVVFVGDSEWLTPGLLTQPQVANVDLLASLTGFLTERKELVSIAPRKINAQAILVTEDGLTGIFLRTVVLMPLAALIFGLGIWWQRRS